MAKVKAQEVIGSVNPDDEFPLTVDEFCAELSLTDRRVELIGAFHGSERRSGRVKDVRSAYASRYHAFINAPA